MLPGSTPRYRETTVPKQVLRNLDLAALAVALDRAEDAGLTAKAPAPRERPADCVYLKYAGKQQAELFARRLPHVEIEMQQPGDEGIGTTTKVIKVFDKAAVLHVLGFLLDAEDIARCTRPLNTVSRSLWVLV
jgi:hypothetical protein